MSRTTVRTHQRRTQNGRYATVRQHTRHYDAATRPGATPQPPPALSGRVAMFSAVSVGQGVAAFVLAFAGLPFAAFLALFAAAAFAGAAVNSHRDPAPAGRADVDQVDEPDNEHQDVDEPEPVEVDQQTTDQGRTP